MDCIPAGMELFPAADEEQWEFIKKVIDDCDYYLLIVGGRYGSVAEDGLSYTEKEFDYAVANGIKVIALVHETPDSLPRDKTEIEPENYQKLQQFKAKVGDGRLVRFWDNASQLSGLVALSLNKTIKMYPATGWVRANAIVSPDLLLEINELRKQNDELKALNLELSSSLPIELPTLADFDSTVKVTGTFKVNARSMYAPTEHHTWSKALKWSELFFILSPLLISTPREVTVNEFLANNISDVNKNQSKISALVVDQQDLFTIRIQLIALGLIEVDGNVDGSAQWKLTDQGYNLMLKSRVVTQ